jgi:EAL domain-containing protein (putative c-di-GMP-specific phosphodiesterase class I)
MSIFFEAKEIQLGLSRHEFVVYSQPKFRIPDGELLGSESLVRWKHPIHGVLTPDYFLEEVINSGLISDLFFEILEQSLTLHRYSSHRGININIALNVHASQLTDKTFSIRINDALRSHNISASNISLELIEVGLLEVTPVVFDNLYELRVMGCGLAIDDFGSGFSSLKRLLQLPFNELKIDATFIENITTSPRCVSIVEAILELAKKLEINVIAEGIETECQLQKLQELGCMGGQGYFYSKPLSLNETMRWIDMGSGRACSSL